MEKITIEAEIAAPIAQVWTAYTTPAHIMNWNFADPSWHCPRAEVDLRNGGRYLARMEARDGSFGFDFLTIYSGIVPEETLTMTMEDGRVTQTNFEKSTSGTRVTTIFDPEKLNPTEMQKTGWQAILNNFKAYCEAL